jgi:hypothetical protein
MAAENDLAHLRMLREKRRVDNADDALLRDPLVAAVHSTCQALHPASWLAQCSAERNTFANGPAQPSNRVLRSRIRARIGQQAADLSRSTGNAGCHHSEWSLLPAETGRPVQEGWPAS